MTKVCYYYMKFIIQKIVVDASVIMGFLSNRKSLISDIIRSGELQLITPDAVIYDVLKRADEWRGNWPNNDPFYVVRILDFYVQITHLGNDSPAYQTAQRGFSGSSTSDTQVLALAKENNAIIWSEGGPLSNQNLVTVITGQDILNESWRLPGLWQELKDYWYLQLKNLIKQNLNNYAESILQYGWLVNLSSLGC